MLKKLIIENYRGYEKHEIDFRDLTIIVGKNNAGKSTLIEALRLLSLVTNKYQSAPYKARPDWLDIGRVNTGVSPSLQRIDFSYKNIFYSYNDPPAIITAEFINGQKIIIYFAGQQKFHAVLYDEKGKVCSKSRLSELNLPVINILPQITPLSSKESVLNVDYVKANVNAPTSSRHFRNQLNYLNQYYVKFEQLISTTWEGIRLYDYVKGDAIEQSDYALLIQEGNYVAEIGEMGHGLQMWVQTMWFLARCDKNSTIVLDEPDVYMHADLQRKLIRLLKNEFNQVVIATHSVEIMSEVEPENILVIDRNRPKSIFASDFTSVQKVLLNMGSIQNIALARLWSANKFLIVEGKDIDILKRLQNVLFKQTKEPFDTIPRMSIGGWGGWSRAIGSKLLLKNAGDENITTYCIFDRDYNIDEEIEKRYDEAKKHGISLKIWTRKEIENYLIIPTAVKRLIEKNSNHEVTQEEVDNAIDDLAESMREDYIDLLTDKIHNQSYKSGKKIEASTARKQAREELSQKWHNKLIFLSGKELIKKLSNWSNDRFNFSFNATKLAQELQPDEIPSEMRDVLTSIEYRQSIIRVQE